MTTVLVDTSVVIKWFHSAGEHGLGAARAIRDAHQRGEIEARVIDLALYEIGNLLLTTLRWPATAIADQLDDLIAVFGTPLAPLPAWLRDAAAIGDTHRLSFYDAAWAASARALNIPLVSADGKLIAAGLAESPASISRRLRLS